MSLRTFLRRRSDYPESKKSIVHALVEQPDVLVAVSASDVVDAGYESGTAFIFRR